MANKRRSAGRRADLHWEIFSGNLNAQGAGVAVTMIRVAVTRSETLMRTRGNLVCWVDGLEAPAVSAQIAIGMHLVPEGTGTTVTVSPFTDGAYPWFYHEIFHVGYEEMVTDVISVQELAIMRKTVDVKAMRVIRPDQEIQMVVENTTIVSALAVNIALHGRFLFAD